MSRVLEELLSLLELERIEENLFRGQSQDLGFRALFGGQVLGQGLSAASRTVEPARKAHSLHAYFLRAGDATLPVVYTVDRVRDGGSFTTRRVVAVQKGQPILTMMASFQLEEEGYTHGDVMPEVPPPEDLVDEHAVWTQHLERIPEPLRERLTAERPLEFRQVDPLDPFHPDVRAPQRAVWFRARGKLPDDPQVHRYLLAYASDYSLLGVALQPHEVSFVTRRLQLASIDHALWIHGELRLDDWLLYTMDSPWAGNGRGLARGRIFSRDGRLVASVAQEGLMRMRKDKA
jgi:acyl-CoA thioesterase-2